jgi:hypothetical protein
MLRRTVLVLAAACLAVPAATQATSAAPTALYQRFEVDRSGEWTTVSLRLDPQAWRTGNPDGPAATPKQWFAAMGALKSLVIGADCAPVVDGPTSYPCAFSVARAILDDDAPSDVSTQDWRSTSMSTLHSTELQIVSAVATPHTPPPVAPLNVGRPFVGLIAPAALRDKVAQANSRVLRVHVRAGSTPMAHTDAKVGSGLLILSSEAAEAPAPVAPAARESDAALHVVHRKPQRR